jgi:hypothetical protein
MKFYGLLFVRQNMFVYIVKDISKKRVSSHCKGFFAYIIVILKVILPKYSPDFVQRKGLECYSESYILTLHALNKDCS